jgi:predicted phage tail protein
LSNVTVSFHKSLLPYTNGVKQIEMTTDVIYFLFLNSLNLFPELERLIKHARFSKLEEIAIIHKGRCLSTEEFLFLAKDGETYYVVPIFRGSGVEIAVGFAVGFAMGTATALLQGQSLGRALLRGLIGGAFGALGAYGFQSFMGPALAESVGAAVAGEAAASMGTTVLAPTIGSYVAAGLASTVGSVVQNTLVPIKTKNKSIDSADSGDRRNNDAFDSQINTIHPNQAISLNYGLLRTAGQIISADINTINHNKGDVISVANYV